MSYYNPGYGYQPNYGMQYPYGGQQFLQGQEWLVIQVPGAIRPYYVHTPSCCVYEYPTVTPIPLGMYSNGIMTLNSDYVGNGGFGAGYLSRSVQTPYSATALALRGGKYPVATYPAIPYYGAQMDFSNPYGMRYGMYGQ